MKDNNEKEERTWTGEEECDDNDDSYYCPSSEEEDEPLEYCSDDELVGSDVEMRGGEERGDAGHYDSVDEALRSGSDATGEREYINEHCQGH